jgi:hypothetical protein
MSCELVDRTDAVSTSGGAILCLLLGRDGAWACASAAEPGVDGPGATLPIESTEPMVDLR